MAKCLTQNWFKKVDEKKKKRKTVINRISSYFLFISTFISSLVFHLNRKTKKKIQKYSINIKLNTYYILCPYISFHFVSCFCMEIKCKYDMHVLQKKKKKNIQPTKLTFHFRRICKNKKSSEREKQVYSFGATSIFLHSSLEFFIFFLFHLLSTMTIGRRNAFCLIKYCHLSKRHTEW